MAAQQATVLFLAANPSDSSRLMLDEEVRDIREKIRGSAYRDRLTLTSRWAVRPDDLLQILNELSPDVVHFSGHGSSSGELVLSDAGGGTKPVTAGAMGRLFGILGGRTRVVLLNACYSESQAVELKDRVDCVIGMRVPVEDRSAIVFAASFYRALGFGRSVLEAVEQGITALALEGLAGVDTPKLHTREGVDPATVQLVDKDDAVPLPMIETADARRDARTGVVSLPTKSVVEVVTRQRSALSDQIATLRDAISAAEASIRKTNEDHLAGMPEVARKRQYIAGHEILVRQSGWQVLDLFVLGKALLTEYDALKAYEDSDADELYEAEHERQMFQLLRLQTELRAAETELASLS